MRMPMFGFLALGFLLFATVIAVACYLVFKSGEQGKTKLSGCAGCAIGFGLLAFAGLGALGCTAVAFLTIPDEAVRRGPIKSFEWRWPPRHAHGPDAPDSPGSDRAEPEDAESHRFQLRVMVRGSADYAEVARAISSWLRDETDVDFSLRTHVRTEDGEEVTELEFELPLSGEDLDEIRSNLERAIPEFELSEGVRVEIKDPSDD